MTKKQLSQLYNLEQDIEDTKELLNDLKAISTSQNVKECEYMLKCKIIERNNELIKLINYIESVDDCLIRRILRLRYIKKHTYIQIAHDIGGGNTDESIRKMIHRFIE